MTTAICDYTDGTAVTTTPQQQTYRMSLETQAAQHLLSNAKTNPDSMQYRLDTARLSHLLPKYSTSTLHRIIESTPESALTILTIIRRYQPNDEQLNDWISVAHINRMVGGLPPEVMLGIPQYKHIEKHDGSNPGRREEQVKALVSVTMYFAADYEDYRYSQLAGTELWSTSKIQFISNAKLSDLITTHENPSAVASIITTRDILDPDQITAILRVMKKTAASINNGVL